jgi:hypothetical protein
MTENRAIPVNHGPFDGAMDRSVEPARGAYTGLWLLYFGTWCFLMVISLVAIKSGVSWAAIALFMAPLTIVGIAWRPLFGLALVFIVLPIGGTLSLSQIFTADRAVGIMFGLGAVIHILATRKPLRLLVLPTLTLIALATLGWLSIFWAEYPPVVYPYAFVYTQMFFYILMAISVCQKEEDLRWPLFAYVAACVLAVLAPQLTGTVTEVGERLTIAIEETGALNPNAFGVLLGLGLLSAIYRYCREHSRLIRLVYIAAFAILPFGVLLTGSRKAVFFLAAALFVPFMFSPWALRRIRLILGIVVLVGLIATAVYVGVKYFLPEKTLERLVSLEYAEESYAVRLGFINDAIAYVLRHPFGAGLGLFRTSTGYVVHNDLFFLLGDLGFLGAAIFAVFAIAMVLSVWRMPNNLGKWYAASIVIFQLFVGLGGTWIFSKHYWLFMAFAWLLGVFQQQAAAPTTPEFVEPAPLDHPLTGLPQPPRCPVQGRWGS